MGVRQPAFPMPDSHPPFSERLQWWQHDRFGLFIHWGLYALPARHEWMMRYERLTPADYRKYFERFEPDRFDPREWARMVKAAGMKYAVLTAKHHEGFCLWDSRHTDYKVTNTPCGRDLLQEWLDAFRAEGIRVGLYYSLLDWHHPHYPIDRNHPQSAASDEEYAALNATRDLAIYQTYLKDQVRELLTAYGRIELLWLDYSFPSGKHGKGRADWDSEGLLAMVRELQPWIIVNDRLDLMDTDAGGDFTTPEQYRVSKWPERNGRRLPWETCQTFSESWGYFRDEACWKDLRQLLVLLIDTVAKGGNLLLNVGPTARGEFDPRARERLADIGAWLHSHGRAVYGCTQAPADFVTPEHCLMTYHPERRRLYLHLLDYPMARLWLRGYAGRIDYAQFLHDGSEIQWGKPRPNVTYQEDLPDEDLILMLPLVKPPVEIPVIELFLTDAP